MRAELLAARKRPGGLSPEQMAQSPVMCDLLGNGDPEVASVELGHKLLEIIEAEDDVLALEAACYSLGLTSAATTHLARLEEFGVKHFVDQRQARRYSDRGIDQLARLISSHWTTRTVPRAELIIVPADVGHIAVMVQLHRQWHIDMRVPELSVRQEDADQPQMLEVGWTPEADQDDGPWMLTALAEPCILPLTAETTVRLVWRGETWPTFVVAVPDPIQGRFLRVQTLGSSCAVGMETL